MRGRGQFTDEDILDRMYNWKFRTAYGYAREREDIPREALAILKSLADDFGNVGWGLEGRAGDHVRDANNLAAGLMGYRWDEAKDFWVRA